MAYDPMLAERIRRILRRRSNILELKMFGGIGFLLAGNMCVAVWKDSLIARLGRDAAPAALEEESVVEFDVTGTPMRGWVMIEADGLESDRKLAEWIDRATDFVATLPKKAPKGSK